jgi:acyl-CoA synthetase (AMP-forming)/AMP-acid ligase II
MMCPSCTPAARITPTATTGPGCGITVSAGSLSNPLITERKKDMILARGFNVYPREVEDTLFGHPKVALAPVIGVPDEKSGESFKAAIQVKTGETATEADILDFCKMNTAGGK